MIHVHALGYQHFHLVVLAAPAASSQAVQKNESCATLVVSSQDYWAPPPHRLTSCRRCRGFRMILGPQIFHIDCTQTDCRSLLMHALDALPRVHTLSAAKQHCARLLLSCNTPACAIAGWKFRSPISCMVMSSIPCAPAQQPSSPLLAAAEAVAAVGPSNGSSWLVVQEGVSHLPQMLRTQDLSQVGAAVRRPTSCREHASSSSPLSDRPLFSLETWASPNRRHLYLPPFCLRKCAYSFPTGFAIDFPDLLAGLRTLAPGD